MAKIIQLEDKEKLYPITKAEAVYTNTKENIEGVLARKLEKEDINFIYNDSEESLEIKIKEEN